MSFFSFYFYGSCKWWKCILLSPLLRTRCPAPSWMDWNQSVDHCESNLQNGAFLWSGVADNWTRSFVNIDYWVFNPVSLQAWRRPTWKTPLPLKIYWRVDSIGVLSPAAQTTWALPLGFPGLMSPLLTGESERQSPDSSVPELPALSLPVLPVNFL